MYQYNIYSMTKPYKYLQLSDLDTIYSKLQNRFEYTLKSTGFPKEPRLEIWGYTKEEMIKEIPELFYQFADMGLEINRGAIFATMPHVTVPIHVDYENNQIRSYEAINIPIFNHENTLMEWFDLQDTKGNTVDMNSKHNMMYNVTTFEENQCVLTDQCIVDQPTLINVVKPHRVINNNDANRVVISVRYKHGTFTKFWQ